MGRPKPLLPWNGGTLVGSQVRSLAEGGISEVIVVLGHAALDVVAHVRGTDTLRILINPIYRQGRTTSIKTGLREVSRAADGVLLLAVDQPRPPDLIRRVLQEHADTGALITMPSYQGRGGHPVVFQRSLLSELLEISEERQGVREVMERHRDQVHRLEVDSPMARLDFNTWEEYREAFARYAAPSAEN
jgi:molybdenum cofactor cytidylyltransferase